MSSDEKRPCYTVDDGDFPSVSCNGWDDAHDADAIREAIGNYVTQMACADIEFMGEGETMTITVKVTIGRHRSGIASNSSFVSIPYRLTLTRPDGQPREVRTRLEWKFNPNIQAWECGNVVYPVEVRGRQSVVFYDSPAYDLDVLDDLADDLRSIREALGGEE